MKALLADLLDKMAETDASDKACLVQLDAVAVVVQAMFSRLDEQRKFRIREEIHSAFEKIAAEHTTTHAELQLLRTATDNLLSRELILRGTMKQ
ncbi:MULTISPECIES: sigma-S stabilization anti-adapter protein IraP [Enterobacteriaceae]|uniref:sigma-S stabilization anti-adapter protein IraP n=1 Tax=Enterobacteriaceae TaxID=543 RepID=UPI002FF9BE99